MSITNFIIVFIILIGVVVLYQKYLERYSYISESDNYSVLQSYLLSDSDLIKSNGNKPIMWIHIPYEYNARNWESFGSRSSCNLNQPYLYLTAKSIIKNCDDSFTICFIDDSSFEKLLPNWNVNLSLISDPILENTRKLGIANLIYKYGGISVPLSFLCFKNLYSLYKDGTRNNKMFVGENIDSTITSTTHDFYPNIEFMGANKGNETVGELIDFMQRIISNDYTAQSVFLGDFNRWINFRVEKGKVNLIDGKYLGIKKGKFLI